jgi:hypothetical protein
MPTDTIESIDALIVFWRWSNVELIQHVPRGRLLDRQRAYPCDCVVLMCQGDGGIERRSSYYNFSFKRQSGRQEKQENDTMAGEILILGDKHRNSAAHKLKLE